MVEISRRQIGQAGGLMTAVPALPALCPAMAQAATTLVIKYSLCHVEMVTGLNLRGIR